jgi:hypothetical protein
MWEKDTCGKVIYMGNGQAPEKLNDTCRETMHVEMMDRGFTVYLIPQVIDTLHALLIFLMHLSLHHPTNVKLNSQSLPRASIHARGPNSLFSIINISSSGS